MDFLPEGRIYPTETNRSLISSQAGLEQAMNENRILEAKACLCNGSHDLIVSLGSGTGIIPREEAAVGIREGTVRDIAIISRVGHPVAFMVNSVGCENGRVRLSSLAEGHSSCVLTSILESSSREISFPPESPGWKVSELLPISAADWQR